MKRVRDAGVIGDAGKFQKKKAEELTVAFNKLDTNIKALLNSYSGASAEANIDAFLRGSQNYKKVIAKIASYGEYQEGVFTHDSDNISRTSQELNTLLSEPLIANQINPTLTDLPNDMPEVQVDQLDIENEGGDINA